MFAAAVLAVTVAYAGALSGCSGHSRQRIKEVVAAGTLGQGEGALSLVTWNGYVEAGGNDPRVDWITPFEKKTNCRVTIRYAANPQEMLALMSKPNLHYDGVAATPEIAGKLVADRQVAPINTALVDPYKDLEPALRAQLTKNDEHYAVPFTWGVNLLMYDPRTVRPGPYGWSAVFDTAQAKKYAGRIVMRDSPLILGDAAVYLRAHNRKLHIKDPFSLTPKQLDAAAALIAKQHPLVKSYWLNPSDAITAFATGSAALGEVWPYQIDVLARAGRQVAGVAPREGVTGWMDAWMIGARADHPNCMYQWLNWTSSPEVQEQVAEWDGVAPANPQACGRDRLRPQFCSAYHVGDRSYLSKVMFGHTSTKLCSSKSCTDYADWNRAWLEATGKAPVPGRP
jgi:putative spermidine/putrescine transport system substrate-binding protein